MLRSAALAFLMTVSAAVVAQNEVMKELTFDMIQQASRDQTLAQFGETAKLLVGKRIRWVGTVIDAAQHRSSPRYVVGMDMTSDVGIDVGFLTDKQTALGLRKGEERAFEGEIGEVKPNDAGRGIFVILIDVRLL